MTAAQLKPDRRRLAHLLRAARSALDPDGVIALVAGILAAPAEVGTTWHRLVADPTPPALSEALEELHAHMAAGYSSRGLSRRDYDLVLANILARPLALLARDLKRALAPGGVAVLAGLLRRQEALVLAAHRAQGLSLERRLVIEGWSTLVLRSGRTS